MAKRHQHLEHAILTLVLKNGDHQGYATTLPTLANSLRPTFPDIADREIIEALKRLNRHYLTLWKYIEPERRFDRYPDQIGDDEQFFGRGDFRMRRTPQTDPQLQTLALEVDAPAASMTQPMDESGRKARFARWEQMGLDRVKADLIHHMGRQEVGGAPDVRELAWDWVRMKET